MAKDKKEDKKSDEEVKPDEKSKPDEKPKPDVEVKPDEKPISKIPLIKKPKVLSHPTIKRDKPQPLVLLAKSFNVSPVILAALKAEYNWKDETLLHQADFVKKATAWITAKI